MYAYINDLSEREPSNWWETSQMEISFCLKNNAFYEIKFYPRDFQNFVYIFLVHLVSLVVDPCKEIFSLKLFTACLCNTWSKIDTFAWFWMCIIVDLADGVLAIGYMSSWVHLCCLRGEAKLWPCLSSHVLCLALGTPAWKLWGPVGYRMSSWTVSLLPSMESLEKEMHELNRGSRTLALLVKKLCWKTSKCWEDTNKRNWLKHKNYTYFNMNGDRTHSDWTFKSSAMSTRSCSDLAWSWQSAQWFY